MLVIDRFENGWAVIEYNGKTFNFPRELIPYDAREGDVLKMDVSVDHEATRKRFKLIKGLADDLFTEE